MKVDKQTEKIDIRFKLLNREASLVSSLLSNGLADLRNISKGDGYYYQGFYSTSIGLERLLKLLILSKNQNKSVRTFNHNIKKLFSEVNISFDKDSIEQSIIDFLNDFALKNRYLIPDIINSKDISQVNNEPILFFYNGILSKILKIHRPRKVFIPPTDFSASVFHISEDFSEITDFQDMAIKGQLIEYASKYLVMYAGRILQPIFNELYKIEGSQYGNPHFSEGFAYLHQGDSYFKTRKTYKS